MLKNVACSVGLACQKVRTSTIANCWKKCVGKDDIIEDQTKLCPFPKEMKAMCDALISNLEADDVMAWIEVDMETPVVYLL